MLPTARFYWLVIGAGAIASTAAAVFSQRLGPALGLQFLLAVDGLLVIVAIIDGILARQQRVSVKRDRLSRLSIGRDNIVTLTVIPPAKITGKQTQYIHIYDAYPGSMAITDASMPLRVSLADRETRTLSYHVKPDKRGEENWGNIYVRQRGPLTLAWHRWKIPQSQTVAVYPDLLGLRNLSVRLAMQASGSIKQKQRLTTGTEFAELRDYIKGDDPRLIDWKATARRGQPLIRVLEPEREQTLIVLLDRGRLMTAQVEGLNRFDWGLNASLSLALAGINRGDRVGIGVFDSTVHTWLPPSRGQQHLATMIERLTTIQPVLLESDYANAVSMLVTQQHRRALVVLITDIVDATASMELLSALARLRPRYLPLCVTLRDPYIQQQAEMSADTVDKAYGRAVALDLLDQRQVAFAKLRQKGVMVLDAPVNQISEELVNQYLRIKARNQL
ncbi:MAG: DUF58 domain-containing protein [Cyanobacteria bacterium P01_F01_bin.150]